MPRRAQPPRLWLKPAERGREAVWCIRDGTRRESTGCAQHDVEGAEKALLDYIAGKYQAPKGLGARLLIDEVMAAYLVGVADDSDSRDYLLATAAPITKWWTGKTLSEVNKANCKAYVKWRTGQNRKRHPNSKKPPIKISDQTARADLRTLRAALNYYKEEHDAQMVVPKLTLPKKRPARVDYWLTRSEVARRLRLARKHPQTKHLCRFMLIGVYSGTRPGAILGLRWVPSATTGWVDLESGTLHRSGTREAESKKRKPRARIHDRLLPHLRRWHVADSKYGITHVVHYRGDPIKKLRNSWDSVGGGQDGPHICRHTAATWLMQAGVDPYEAAAYLGMSVETLLGVYGHHHPDFQEAAATATVKRKARTTGRTTAAS